MELTAREVVARIQADAASRGYPWATETVDTFKAGDPDRAVTGIATSWMATSDVIVRAAEAGCNLLVTHEPTFWNHLDRPPTDPDADEVHRAKLDLLDRTGMTVWRFHDHNHVAFDRDPVLAALFDRLNVGETTTGRFLDSVSRVPETTLRGLAESIARSLGTDNVRWIGDADLPVRAFGLGAHNLDTCRIDDAPVDAILVGEVREWDTFAYYRDAAALGLGRGLIVISHRDLETWGATALANWLAGLVPEVPVVDVPSPAALGLIRVE